MTSSSHRARAAASSLVAALWLTVSAAQSGCGPDAFAQGTDNPVTDASVRADGENPVEPDGGDAAVVEGEGEEGSSGTAVGVEEVTGLTVAQAVTRSCSTTVVRGLASQLVDEARCMYPRAFRSITGLRNVALGSAVWPYVQAPIAEALTRAAATTRSTITINSALRTLPQQYILHRWYQTRRCGIVLARPPGVSNHEDGRALDVASAATWRRTFENAGFHWWGADDPMHFDINETGLDLTGTAVRAFQRLWNRNHPEDLLPENGVYDAATEQRLARAPASGFARTRGCTAIMP